MTSEQASHFAVTLQGDLGSFAAALTCESRTEGLEEVRLTLRSDTPQPLSPLALTWVMPCVDIYSQWNPALGWRRGLGVEWEGGLTSSAVSNAPVACLYNLAGRSRLTFAFSDALNAVRLRSPVHEETVEIKCAVQLFQEPGPPITEYQAVLRLDTRDIPYFEALNDVQRWWAEREGYAPAAVPDAARQPMYSTWYSMHQNVTAEAIEAQCRLAKDLGCLSVIVDDGWQTIDGTRGYAYCGDWEPESARIPDMAAHVARVHAIGLHYLLWYSVPFVGIHSRAWERFSGKLLRAWKTESGDTGVLDPRFPEVREYLLNTCEQALRAWDLDGFKLDFVDSFTAPDDIKYGEGRDYDSVPQAADRLLSDIMMRLRTIKPGIMIEFRQSYVGPLMRKYGNMFRAADCPADPLSNRLRTLDIRLLCGGTACHADMMQWHPNESAEAAALHFINTLFAVPQLSVWLDTLSPDHLEMVRWWLGFFKEHRGVLLDGALQPLHPEALYPIVMARDDQKLIIAAYVGIVIVPVPLPGEVWLVNGTQEERLVLDLPTPWRGRVTVRDCRGRAVRDTEVSLAAGLNSLPLPRSGTAQLLEAKKTFSSSI